MLWNTCAQNKTNYKLPEVYFDLHTSQQFEMNHSWQLQVILLLLENYQCFPSTQQKMYFEINYITPRILLQKYKFITQ